VPPTYLDADTGGIIANLTAVRPQKNAVVTVWPHDGSTMPWVSNINPRSGDIVANMMITGLGKTNGDFNVHNMSSGSTDILVDLVGTFERYGVAPATTTAFGSTVTGLTPKAVVTGR
jgi:serine protease